MNKNLKWIQSGKTGCTFATLFSKHPEAVGWKFVTNSEYTEDYNLHYTKRSLLEDVLIVSIVFEESILGPWNKDLVRTWALLNGFYEEPTSDHTTGLRIDCPQGKSWVQYFGPDSHVVTRRAPEPMLMFTRKLNIAHYTKVGWKGILHLAHAWKNGISEKVYDLLWERSYKQTRKLLGHEPTIEEAAKTTFKNGN